MAKAKKSKNKLDTSIHKERASDYLQDQRKIKASLVLAYSGYCKDAKVRGAVTQAAKVAEVNRQTIYYWMENDPLFVQAIEEAKFELCEIAVRGLKKLAEEGNPTVCMFLAERLAPEIFSSQYRKFEHEKEMLRLKTELEMNDGQEANQPPVIIISCNNDSLDYERNKI